MDEQKIIQSFKDYLKGKGFDEKSLSLKFLPDLFIDFYRDVKFEQIVKEDDYDDFLLFESGLFGRKDEVFFLIDFTRRVRKLFEDEVGKYQYYRTYQCRVAFLYEPEAFEFVPGFTEWSTSFASLEEFKSVIIDSSVFQTALSKEPVEQKVKIDVD